MKYGIAENIPNVSTLTVVAKQWWDELPPAQLGYFNVLRALQLFKAHLKSCPWQEHTSAAATDFVPATPNSKGEKF